MNHEHKLIPFLIALMCFAASSFARAQEQQPQLPDTELIFAKAAAKWNMSGRQSSYSLTETFFSDYKFYKTEVTDAHVDSPAPKP